MHSVVVPLWVLFRQKSVKNPSNSQIGTDFQYSLLSYMNYVPKIPPPKACVSVILTLYWPYSIAL